MRRSSSEKIWQRANGGKKDHSKDGIKRNSKVHRLNHMGKIKNTGCIKKTRIWAILSCFFDTKFF
jgi:hypothetical protein